MIAASVMGRLLVLLSAALVVASCAERGDAELPRAEGQAAEAPAPIERIAEAKPEQERAAVEISAAPAPAPGPKPEVLPGTGVFIDQAAAKRRRLRVTPAGDTTFNFVDASINEVVRAILGDTLKANYVIDPQVKGMVTVQTSRPLPKSALVGALESILSVVGAALVQADGLYKIVPAAEAPRGAPTPTLGPRRRGAVEGFGVHIVPLNFVAAAEMAKILEPVAPQGSVLRVDAARNLLVLSGSGGEIESLLEMIDLFDVDWLKGTSFALYPLEAAEAKELAAELEEVFGTEAEGPLAGLVRLIPIERINTILVISPNPTYLEQVGTWVKRLDRGGDGVEQRLYVYYVQNGRALDLATVLRDIFALAQPAAVPERFGLAPGLRPVEITTPGARRSMEQERRQAPGAERRRPEARRTGAAREPARAREEGERTAAAEERGEERERPRRAEPARREAAAARAPRTRAEVALAPELTSAVRIIADEATNALVILATPREYRQIEAALRKLDIVPLQVLIEATIAEVTLRDELRYGVQWFLKDLENVDIRLGDLTAGSVFSAVFSRDGDPRALLNLLQGITDVNVISSPQLMVLDNQTAFLSVGDQVPISTGRTTGEGGTTIVEAIQFRDTGVVLSVTPRVNAGGLVTMDIEQEVSDAVTTTTSLIVSPTIQQRLIRTTVAIQSGETVALGGLIRDSKTSSKSGVPILQHLPLLGPLFRDTANTADRTELLVLITPRVIRNMQEARDVTEELRRRFRTLIPLGRKIE